MKQLFYAIDQVLHGTWLIDSNYVLSRLPILQLVAQGSMQKMLSSDILKGLEQNTALPVAFSGSLSNREYYQSFDEVPEGSIALNHVKGPLMKKDFYGPGTASLIKTLKAADRHDNIIGHLLYVDSPGGTVDGTKDFADAIENTAKPVVSFVDGIGGSAAYWMMSGSQEIIASNHTTMIGSIGTMLGLQDFRGFFEDKLGMKFHDITADESYEKNATYYELLKGNYKPVKEQVLNPLNEIFLNAVRKNRPNVNDKALHGRVFLAQDAIKYGIADAIGDFDYAVSRVYELAKASADGAIPPSKKVNNQTQNHMSLKNWLSGAKSDANAENKEESARELTVQTAELDQLRADMQSTEAKVESLTTENAGLKTEKENLTAQITEKDATIAQLTAERDEWKTKAVEYGAQPGAEHSTPVKPEGDKLDEGEDENQALIDSLPHNQEADKNFNFSTPKSN